MSGTQPATGIPIMAPPPPGQVYVSQGVTVTTNVGAIRRAILRRRALGQMITGIINITFGIIDLSVWYYYNWVGIVFLCIGSLFILGALICLCMSCNQEDTDERIVTYNHPQVGSYPAQTTAYLPQPGVYQPNAYPTPAGEYPQQLGMNPPPGYGENNSQSQLYHDQNAPIGFKQYETPPHYAP